MSAVDENTVSGPRWRGTQRTTMVVDLALLEGRGRGPLCRPRASPPAVAGDGDRQNRLRILQATSTAFCVVHNPLISHRRGFDDRTRPSANMPSADSLSVRCRALKSPGIAPLSAVGCAPPAGAKSGNPLSQVRLSPRLFTRPIRYPFNFRQQHQRVADLGPEAEFAFSLG